MRGNFEFNGLHENPNSAPAKMGWIEVITGSMFSGKTEELLRRIRRALIARQACLLVKPQTDTRYSADHVVSHDQIQLPCIQVKEAAEILALAREYSVVAIDEAQFFDSSLIPVCQELADSGRRVIVAGLDQDYLGRPFEPIPELMACAEFVTKQLAICVQCGNPAIKNQRLVEEAGRVVLGAKDIYEARCRSCFEPPKAD